MSIHLYMSNSFKQKSNAESSTFQGLSNGTLSAYLGICLRQFDSPWKRNSGTDCGSCQGALDQCRASFWQTLNLVLDNHVIFRFMAPPPKKKKQEQVGWNGLKLSLTIGSAATPEEGTALRGLRRADDILDEPRANGRCLEFECPFLLLTFGST